MVHRVIRVQRARDERGGHDDRHEVPNGRSGRLRGLGEVTPQPCNDAARPKKNKKNGTTRHQEKHETSERERGERKRGESVLSSTFDRDQQHTQLIKNNKKIMSETSELC